MVVRPRSSSGVQRLRLGQTGQLLGPCPILRRCSQVAELQLALVPVAGLRTTKTLMTDVGECLLICVLVQASSSTTLVASSSTASSADGAACCLLSCAASSLCCLLYVQSVTHDNGCSTHHAVEQPEVEETHMSHSIQGHQQQVTQRLTETVHAPQVTTAVCCSLRSTHYLLLTALCSLRSTHCLLLSVFCTLPSVLCPPLCALPSAPYPLHIALPLTPCHCYLRLHCRSHNQRHMQMITLNPR